MKFSDSIKNIAIALAQFQGEVTAAPKDAMNPHFKKKYATLDAMITAIRPALAKCGLSFIQNNIEDEAGRIGVYTMIFHESGENITFDPVYIPLEKKTAQGIGLALTYSRRYSLGTALGIATDEDDDGNSIEPERKKYDNQQTTSNKPPATQQQAPEPPVAKMTEETLNKIKNIWTAMNLAPEKINIQTDRLYKLPLYELTEEQGKDFLLKLEANQTTPDTKPSNVTELKGKMSAEQRNKIFKSGSEKGLKNDDTKKVAYSYTKLDSMTKMTKQQAHDVIEFIEKSTAEELQHYIKSDEIKGAV
jgi:hypothetical protein